MQMFNKWVAISIIVILYALVTTIAFLTHQPPELLLSIIKDGGGGVAILCGILAFFG